MIRAIWEEVRRAFRMAFGEEVRAAFKQGRSHPGWGADPYLMRGWRCAAPAFVLSTLATFAFLVSAGSRLPRSPWTIVEWETPGAILANLAWFGVAAYSRRRAG